MKKNYNIKTSNNSKKTPSFYVVLFALIFTFIGSILGSVAFIQNILNKDFENNNTTLNSYDTSLTSVNDTISTSNNAFSASTFDSNNTIINPGFETIYDFQASNVYVPMIRTNFSGDTYNYSTSVADMFNFKFNCAYTDNHDGGMADGYQYSLRLQPIEPSNNQFYVTYNRIIGSQIYSSTSYMPFSDLVDTQDENLNNISYPNSILYTMRFGTRTSSVKYQCYFRINFKSGNDFKLNFSPITRVDFDSVKVDWSNSAARYYIGEHTGSTNKDLFYFNTIKYYQGSYLAYEFGFLTYDVSTPTVFSQQLFEARTYYTLAGIENKSDYQLGYNNGKLDGIKDGIASGTEDGFERGKIAGEQIGYDKGFNAGVESAGSNNFFTLIGAVIDVPITAVRSLLNFDLLGFNMFNFFSALLTIGIIIFVVRLFI